MAKERFDLLLFGRRFAELTPDEKRRYNRIKKNISRQKDPHRHEKDREYYLKNKDRISERGKAYRERNKGKITYVSQAKPNPFEKCLPMKLFGKHIPEMTPEEKKIYNKVRCLRYQKRRRDESKSTEIL